MDKLLSIVMAIVLVFTTGANVIPIESQATDLKNTTLDSDISIKSTNSFGNMLSAELDSEVADQEENNGYNVFSAEVTGTEVAVSFETMSDCTLLAAIYDEAGESLIASGTAQVTEEETEKTVTIEIDEMPQYFYLKVYLVDENTLRPMCTAYESPNYTQEMQEFFALTVDDFESDRVLNLDEDEINNFAVYGEDVIIIESDETVNTVTVADIDNENYVIENADSTVTSLQIGDVFVIEQTSGEILIVKVGEIIVDGTTATITGEDTEMEEVFEIVKIDTTQTNEEATVDTSDMSQGVTYEGETNEIQPLTARAKKSSGGDTATTSLKFSFKFLEGNSDDGSTSGSLSGSVSLSSTLNLKYYISWSRQYAEFKFNDEFNFSVAFSGEMKKEFKLGKVDFALCPGLYVSMVPKVVFEFSLSTHIDFTVENIRGFSVEHTKKGFEKKNIGKKPKMKSISLTVEGALSVGVSISADICLVHRNIFRAGFEASAKLELSLEESKRLLSSEHPDSKHTCRECLEGDLSVKTEISFNVTFLNSKKLSLKWVIASKEAKLSDIYFSFDNMKGELTTCPYYAYRTDFEITDSDGNAIEDLTLEIRDMRTNKWLDGINGTKNIYLLGGRSYHVRTYYNGIKYEDIFKVKKSAKRVVLKIDNNNASAPVTTATATTTETTTTETTTTTTDSSVVASGTCGENLTWVLDDEGTLTISGTGDMYDWEYYNQDYDDDAPWFEYCFNSILNVVIEGGITSIGSCAFVHCKKLTEITIPESVISIGDHAFIFCNELTEITIPDSVISIGDRAFNYCDKLTTITLGSGVESIGDCFNTYALTNINVDAENSNFTSVDGVLFDKDMRVLVKYPVGRTEGTYTIPESVEYIGKYSFLGCETLHTITIPDRVIYIALSAFSDCSLLTTITLPNSIIKIDRNAFDNCYALTDIYYSGTKEQWNEIAIGSEYLTQATIHYNGTGSQSTASLLTMTKKSAEETTLLTESFTDLLPNEVYNFYVMKSRAAESTFSGGNLLYVTQAVSDENGELTISYIPKEAFETADIFVAGLTRTDISAAEATVPEITYIGEEILVNPDVTLNGQALIEGIDYDIEGGYLVTQPGDYTITIVGNGDYIGEKDIMFTAICIHSYDGQICMICGNKNPDILEFLLGDVNGDSSVDSSDASLVLAEYAKIQTGGAGEFTETQRTAADVNNDDVVDSSDASKILAYYAMVSTGKEPTWD